jgi:hypothetical protein
MNPLTLTHDHTSTCALWTRVVRNLACADERSPVPNGEGGVEVSTSALPTTSPPITMTLEMTMMSIKHRTLGLGVSRRCAVRCSAVTPVPRCLNSVLCARCQTVLFSLFAWLGRAVDEFLGTHKEETLRAYGKVTSVQPCAAAEVGDIGVGGSARSSHLLCSGLVGDLCCTHLCSPLSHTVSDSACIRGSQMAHSGTYGDWTMGMWLWTQTESRRMTTSSRHQPT